MRAQDFRAPTTGADSVEHQARLLRLWEGPGGLKGFLGTVDHKQIGIRYIVTAFVFLVLGGLEALVMRLQLAGPNRSLLTPEQYNQLFSTHGMTMIFLYASPVLSGFANYLWPLLLGSRDMAFPRLNALGYWVYLASGIFLYVGFLTGNGPNDGWFNYVPYAARDLQPGSERGFLFAGHGVPRHLDHRRRGELHRDRAAHARPGHVDQSPADSHLGHAHRQRRQSHRGAGGQPRFPHAVDGPPVRHAFLRSRRRRPAAAVAASVLDLRPSLGLRHRAAGHGHGVRRPAGVLPPPAGRIFVGGPVDGRHHDPGLRRVGASHVRHRTAWSWAVVLLRRLDRHHGAFRGGGICLARHDLASADRWSRRHSCSLPR